MSRLYNKLYDAKLIQLTRKRKTTTKQQSNKQKIEQTNETKTKPELVPFLFLLTSLPYSGKYLDHFCLIRKAVNH